MNTELGKTKSGKPLFGPPDNIVCIFNKILESNNKVYLAMRVLVDSGHSPRLGEVFADFKKREARERKLDPQYDKDLKKFEAESFRHNKEVANFYKVLDRYVQSRYENFKHNDHVQAAKAHKEYAYNLRINSNCVTPNDEARLHDFISAAHRRVIDKKK